MSEPIGVMKLLQEGPNTINVGLRSFHESSKDQDISSSHVEWKPPAGGDKELINLLNKLM